MSVECDLCPPHRTGRTYRNAGREGRREARKQKRKPCLSQGVTGYDKHSMLNPGSIRRLDDATFPLLSSLSGLGMGARYRLNIHTLAPKSQGGSIGRY